MSGWPGLRAALATDPDGVAAVLRTVRAIPVSAGRASSSPPLWAEIARMIEVQRAYELGQGFLDNEDRRIRSVVEALGRG